MCTIYRGLPRFEVWGRIIRSLEGTLGAKKSGQWMSHPHAGLKGHRSCLGPWGSRGRVDVKTLSAPRDVYVPLEDSATLATSGALVAFLTNQTGFAK
jgi:hypothetical protein